MFGMTKGPTEEYIKRLKKDFDEVRHLTNSVSFIHFVPSGKHPEIPTLYKIYMEIRSIVAVDEDSGKIDLAEAFTFDIKLSSNYPSSKPECIVTPIPFHPHFEPRFKQGVWIYPYKSDEGLGSLLLRIAHSLKYEPAYVNEQCQDIGNKKALLWYMRAKQESPNLFPIDKKLLPYTLHTTVVASPKKFEIINNQRTTKSLPVQHPTKNITSPRKTFKIVESTSAYEPIVKKSSGFSTILHSDFRNQKSDYELYIEEKAKNQIFEHIDWGQRTELNQVEQGGILLGQVYKDTYKRIVYGVVEEALAGKAATGTNVYLEMDHTTWKTMIDRVDRILDAHVEKKLQIIGWYHTHPNHLDVFMSSTDTATQSRLFSQDWHFAIVMNPHKKIWRVFQGGNSKECKGFMIEKPKEYTPILQPKSETYPTIINQFLGYWVKKKYIPILIVVLLICLGTIGIIYVNVFNSTQQTVSVSSTTLNTNVLITPTVISNIVISPPDKSSLTLTNTIFSASTTIPTKISTLVSVVPPPIGTFTSTPSPTEIVTPTSFPTKTSAPVPTISISSSTPLTNSTLVSPTANILPDVCLQTDKLYRFEAQALIAIYDIYISTDNPIGIIQQNEVFYTGTQASGEILGIILSNNKDWFYITYKENRYWILLDDLQKSAICIS